MVEVRKGVNTVERKIKMKKWIVLLVVVVAAVAAYFSMGEKPVVVQAKQVVRGEVQQTVTNTRSGSVKACRRSKLSVPIGGQIDSVLVKEGDKVEAGQLLMTLFNDDIQAQLEQARAQLTAAEMAKKRQCLLADSDQHEAERLQKLIKKGLASEEQLDLATAKADASNINCEATNADIQQAHAQVKLLDAQLTKTQLNAPFAGTVAELNGEVGEFATPSPPGIPTLPMVDLIDDSCFYVSAPIDEVDAGKLSLGLPVTITLDAFRDEAISGRVRRIAPYVYAQEKQARTVEVEADIVDRKMRRLLVGYSADVTILIQAHKDVLQVPTEAIFDQNQVYVLKDGHLQLRNVTTGLSNWQTTEVLSGVEEGEWVMTSAEQTDLADGMAATRK